MSDKKQISKLLKGLSHTENSNESNSQNTSDYAIQLPRDMYLHLPIQNGSNQGCATEWWWHTGTLKTDNGRLFGFEINAAAYFYPIGFTEVMLTDVKNQKHYHQTVGADISKSDNWAESDPSKNWYVNLNDVSMNAPQADPTQNMVVKAKLVDGETTITFDLTLSQKGKPLIVWGTGVQPTPPPKPTLKDNNFYFSLTRLQAQGTITINTTGDSSTEILNVSGVTWMDHEWGKFKNNGKALKWILQDMQFSNGMCISNYSMQQSEGKKSRSGKATIQLDANSPSVFVDTLITPLESTTIDGKVFFTKILVKIPDYGISVIVKSLMPNQLFTGVYEGVASVSGTMETENEIISIDGTAWIEQTSD